MKGETHLLRLNPHMIRIIVLLFVTGNFSTCNYIPETKQGVQTAHLSKEIPALDYVKCKDSLASLRKSLKNNWALMPFVKKERIFAESVTGIIIPAWMGTPWDFNGTTEEPGNGKIACGYFVTTVLRDAGVKLNRVKLAQCASSEMIRTLLAPKNIRSFYNGSFKSFYSFIAANGFGLYIVGLDNHTGFIYHDGEEIYFIHSSFVGANCVQKERALDSWILKESGCHILGRISGDIAVLNSWAQN